MTAATISKSAWDPAEISLTEQHLQGRCQFYPVCLSWWEKTGQGSGEIFKGSGFLSLVGTFHEKAHFPSYAFCQLAGEDSSCGKSCPLSGRMGSGEEQEAVPSLKRKSVPWASGKATVTTQSSYGWNALSKVVCRAPVPESFPIIHPSLIHPSTLRSHALNLMKPSQARRYWSPLQLSSSMALH